MNSSPQHAPIPVLTRAGEPAGLSEEGYMLVAVVVMVALVLIALSVAAPVVAKNLRREKEVESEHRAEQYVRAIRLYYRKTHAYPPSLDALKQSNNVRYLRQEYVDPLTGKADWRIIHQGEQKTTVKGFFGQELGGLGSAAGGASLGSASGMGAGIGNPVGGGAGGSTSTVGQTSALASGFAGASVTTGGSGAAGATGNTGGLGSLSGSASGGVGPIVGVGPAATGTSIADPNQQTTYETWEFWYDPRIELLYQKGQQNAGIGTGAVSSQSPSSFGTNANGLSNGSAGSGFGSGSSGSGAGGSFGNGSSSFGSGSSSFGNGSATSGNGTGSSTGSTGTPRSGTSTAPQ